MIEEAVARWVRPELLQQRAYHVPPSQGLVKLDAMESPYTFDPAVRAQWLHTLDTVSLNRYPAADAPALCAALRDAFDIPDELGVLLGNGSDELIQILMLAVARPGATVLAPEPTFVMYKAIASWLGLRFVGVPLRENFGLDMPAMLAAIREHSPALTFISYPNNPTGNLFPRADIDALLDASPGLLVIDEAYQPFAGDSYLPAVAQHERLLVMRTVSKMGLAGLRLGYLVGAPQWLDQFNKVRLPYNINVLTQVSAEFALGHHAMFEHQAQQIVAGRGRLLTALAQLPGLTVYPSQANFILFRTPAGRADAIFQGLLAGGVLIKNLSPNGGLLRDCLRVTVGTEAENQRFLQVLEATLK